MNIKLLEILIVRLIIVSLPTPTIPTPSIWIVMANGNKVYIESMNRITANIKSKRKFPKVSKWLKG